jgi:hypothetical protein
MLQTVYNLKDDKQKIAQTQRVSIDKSSPFGLKAENNLLFGSDKWFAAIENGEIKKHRIKGKISKVYMSGHNDWPEFEIENEEGKTSWTREGADSAYGVGRDAEIIYVEQKFKKPIAILGPFSKCVIQINIKIPD